MRQEEILTGLRELGPSTIEELSIHIYGYCDHNTRNSANTRLHTLCKQGFVRKVGTRLKPEGARGRRSPIWELVE